MALDCLAGNGRSGVVLGLSHALMEPGVVGASVGWFILATYFFKSAPIGFIGLVHLTLRQNAVRKQCNKLFGAIIPFGEYAIRAIEFRTKASRIRNRTSRKA